MSNASNLSTLANVLDDGSDGQFLKSTGSGGVAFDTVAAGAVVYATADLLPLSGNSAGDMAYVTATNRFYINNGSGWYSVSLVNTNPNITSVQDASSNTTPFTLATDGTATVITVTAADPEEVPLTYGYSVTSGSLNGSTVTQGTGSNTNVFTVTPHASQEATFTLTFTASDGINQATSANAFSLSFITTVADSNHTTLLATATGTSDNNNITDSSSNNHSITVTGDAYAGTFSPYRSGGYSTYFDGSGDHIRYSDASLAEGTDDFTVEFWVRRDGSQTVNDTIVGHDTTPGYQVAFTSNALYFHASGSDSDKFLGTGVLNDKQWYHVVYQRSSGTLQGFLDGVSLGTQSVTTNFTNSIIEIGVNRGGTAYFKGHVRDVRIIKGTAFYSSSGFDVPTESLTAVSGTGYSTTLLSCHLPYIADGGANSLAPTINGDPETKPFSPYDYNEYDAADHGGSVFLGGTAHDSEDRLEITRDTSLTMGSGDFTYEAWVYLYSENVANEASLFSARASGYESFILKVRNSGTEGTNLLVSNSTGNSWSVLNAKGGAVFANVWTHVAIVRNGTSIKVYTNGKEAQSHTFSGSLNEDNNILYIGYDSDSRYGLGHVSDVRITKGTAVYTTEFTPPTAPLSSSGASLHIKGTDASIIDKSQSANLKLVGNTAGSTTTNFTGAKSIYIDGPNGDYITLPASDNYKLGTGDFTLETWVKVLLVSNDSGRRRLFNQVDTASSTTGQLELMVYPDGYFYVRSGSNIFATTTDFSDGSWYHLALVRHSSVLKIYVDGSLENSANNTTDFSPSAISPIIGRSASTASNSRFQGYIQDFRITKGKARYTANFTPPSAPLEG